MKERFEVLDVFRGIFAVMVVFFHLTTFTETKIINNSFFNNADVFVDFFFVLSGFVIAHNYKEISSFEGVKSFYKKRFLRVYPLHIIMLFAFLVVEMAKDYASNYIHINQLNNEDNTVFSFLTAVFLINSIKLPAIIDVSWNMVSWSISAEMIAYLLFGLLSLCLYRINGTKYKSLVYFLIVCIGMAAIYYLTSSFKLTYNFDYGFIRGSIGFFTGALCYSLYISCKKNLELKNSAFFTAAEVLSVASIGIFVYFGDLFRYRQYIYEILFFLAVLVFSFESGLLSLTLKKSSFLRSIGKYSYSIYMTHALLLSLFNVLFIRILKFPAEDYYYLFILNFILIYIVAKWTYENIEKRFFFVKQSFKK